MPKQQGFAHLILILLVVIIAVIGYLVFAKKLPINQQASTPSSASEPPLLQTEYQNPFEEKSQYSNPFSESDYQNPFDNIAQ